MGMNGRSGRWDLRSAKDVTTWDGMWSAGGGILGIDFKADVASTRRMKNKHRASVRPTSLLFPIPLCVLVSPELECGPALMAFAIMTHARSRLNMVRPRSLARRLQSVHAPPSASWRRGRIPNLVLDRQ